MISLSTKTDKNGFWFLLHVDKSCHFTLSYIVIGSGGRQSSGEITGSASETTNWQFQSIDFPVLRVGVTDLRLDEQSLAQSPEPRVQLPADSLSRRKAIKAVTTTLLTGGAMVLFPSGSSFGRALPGNQSNLEEPGETTGSYNPYGEDKVSSFNPY